MQPLAQVAGKKQRKLLLAIGVKGRFLVGRFREP